MQFNEFAHFAISLIRKTWLFEVYFCYPVMAHYFLGLNNSSGKKEPFKALAGEDILFY